MDQNIMNEKHLETIEADIADDVCCILIENYVRTTLSPPSIDMFNDDVVNVGIDLNEICKAAGRAILNEAVLKCLEKEIARIENDIGKK